LHLKIANVKLKSRAFDALLFLKDSKCALPSFQNKKTHNEIAGFTLVVIATGYKPLDLSPLYAITYLVYQLIVDRFVDLYFN